MAFGVVNLLKIIQINDHQCSVRRFVPILHIPVDRLYGSIPVKQSCQRIPHGLFPVLLLLVLSLCVIYHHGMDPVISPFVLHNAAAEVHPTDASVPGSDSELGLYNFLTLMQLLQHLIQNPGMIPDIQHSLQSPSGQFFQFFCVRAAKKTQKFMVNYVQPSVFARAATEKTCRHGIIQQDNLFIHIYDVHPLSLCLHTLRAPACAR